MSSASTLPAQAATIAKAAVNASLVDAGDSPEVANSIENGNDEDGEVQEVNMEEQAEGIRTVFQDPKNFNVKVRPSLSVALQC
jgi:translation initiation factor 4E